VVPVIIYRQLLNIRRTCVIGNAFGSPRRPALSRTIETYWNIDCLERCYIVDNSDITRSRFAGESAFKEPRSDTLNATLNLE